MSVSVESIINIWRIPGLPSIFVVFSQKASGDVQQHSSIINQICHITHDPHVLNTKPLTLAGLYLPLVPAGLLSRADHRK